MKRVAYGDTTREVSLRRHGDEIDGEIDGEAVSLSVRRIAPGHFVATGDGAARTFYCARDGALVYLFWNGAHYAFEELGEGRRAAARGDAGVLEAPMPGKVIEVAVEVGQSVVKGDVVLVIEAMKMENALRAPRDGVVAAIAARVGDLVAPGSVLVQLEDPS